MSSARGIVLQKVYIKAEASRLPLLLFYFTLTYKFRGAAHEAGEVVFDGNFEVAAVEVDFDRLTLSA